MAFKVVNDIVIKNNTDINVDGMEVLVGDGDPNTKVLLQNVQLTTNVLSDSNLTTDNLLEGTTNLYFNDLRAQAALAGDIATLQADIANAIVTANSYTDAAVSVGTGNLTTDDIPEGSNLYYTDARVDARIPTTLSSFTNDSNFATVAYTDQSEIDAVTTANTYTDTREVAITAAYTSAIAAASAAGSSGSNAYTDQEVANAITTMTAYTDQAEADALATANTYTDTREVAITSAYQLYADQAEADALATANTYTDTREVAITSAYQLYADQAEADAIATAANDATAKANAAQSAAEATAAVDATTKADQAEADAIIAANSYTDTQVTKTVIDGLNIEAASVQLNSVALGTDTIGNYVATISGTTNEIEVTGSGTETASVTVGLPADITVSNNLTVQGDLTVNGTTTTVLSESTRINENILYLNEGGDATITNAVGNGSTVTYTADNSFSTGYTVNVAGVNPSSFNVTDALVVSSDSTSFTISSTNTDTYVSGGTADGHAHVNVDLGWAGAYDDGIYKHAGLFRDATDGVFKVFEGYTLEPNDALDINTAHASFSLADFEANNITIGSTPTLSNHAATKSYVDTVVSSGTGSLTTDDITEGTNLYYTDARVDARIPTNISTFTNDSSYATTSQLFSGNYNDLTNTPSNISAFTNDENYIAKDTSGPQHWVDLGNNTALYWGTSNTNITGYTGTIDMKPNGTGVASFETTGLVIDLLKDIRYQKNTGVYTTLDFAGTVNSSNETIIIPDASGTMALTSDLTNLVTQTSLEQHIGDSSVDGTIGNTIYHRILTSKNDAIADANSYTDTEIAALPSIPINVSAFNNDSNYSTFTSNQNTDTTSNVLFKTIEINTNNQTSETDIILNANSVIGSNNSINMALTDTGGTFRWWIGTTDHATGTAGGSTYMTLNSTQLSVTGEIVASGDVCAYSDRRLKRNIETIDNALDKVNNLRGVTFEKGLQPSLGVIAQEVEEVLPELVKTDSDGMKSVAYGNMVGLLIEAIKEQQKQIDDLKQRLENT